jgi:hypothetical protein
MNGARLTRRPWGSDRERRQAFLAAAVLLGATAALLVWLRPGHAGDPPRRDPASALAAPAASPASDPPTLSSTRSELAGGQDAQNRDPRFRQRLAGDLRSRPAFQRLPYRARGVTIELAGTAPHGRLLLRVRYRTNRARARRAYRGFLARYRDPGCAYRAVFVAAGGRR